jgi:hypothetical protein
LNIVDSATDELDLGQEPLHMIAADLKNIYNMEITNDKVMIQAKGLGNNFENE